MNMVTEYRDVLLPALQKAHDDNLKDTQLAGESDPLDSSRASEPVHSKILEGPAPKILTLIGPELAKVLGESDVVSFLADPGNAEAVKSFFNEHNPSVLSTPRIRDEDYERPQANKLMSELDSVLRFLKTQIAGDDSNVGDPTFCPELRHIDFPLRSVGQGGCPTDPFQDSTMYGANVRDLIHDIASARPEVVVHYQPSWSFYSDYTQSDSKGKTNIEWTTVIPTSEYLSNLNAPNRCNLKGFAFRLSRHLKAGSSITINVLPTANPEQGLLSGSHGLPSQVAELENDLAKENISIALNWPDAFKQNSRDDESGEASDDEWQLVSGDGETD